jgi:uncharacterized protein (DUF305 family)
MMTLRTASRRLRRLATAAAVGLVAVAVMACGDESDRDAKAPAGNGIDVAFVDAMIPHHQNAVEMAELAQVRGQSPFVRELATDIIDAQKREIEVMSRIKEDLAGIRPQDLGVAEHAMGVDDDLSQLRRGATFDRRFIDMMIPHHQGAIRMARVQLAKGADRRVTKIAQDVVRSQTREIDAMNDHRRAEFGAASPAGSAPGGEAETGGGHEAMGHGG